MNDQHLPPVPDGLPPAPSPGPEVPPFPRASTQAARSPGRTGLVIGGVLVAAVLLLGGGGLAAAAAAVSTSAAPERHVQQFLQSLVDGRAEAALRIMGEQPSGLLTDDAYLASSNHITGFSLGQTRTTDDTATVTAMIAQGGMRYPQEFTLRKAGSTFLVFDTWALQPLDFGSVSVGVAGPDGLGLTVDGNEIVSTGSAGAELALPAFPGDYEVAIAVDDEYFASEPVTASVVGLSDRGAGAGSAFLETALTDAGVSLARASVDSFFDSCVAQDSLKPEGCGFEALPEAGTTYSNVVWTITTRPTFSLGAWADGGWEVTTDTGGALDVTASAVDAAGRTGTAGTTVPDVRYSGVVTISDGVATFTPRVRSF